jgi:hypothetical protein
MTDVVVHQMYPRRLRHLSLRAWWKVISGAGKRADPDVTGRGNQEQAAQRFRRPNEVNQIPRPTACEDLRVGMSEACPRPPPPPRGCAPRAAIPSAGPPTESARRLRHAHVAYETGRAGCASCMCAALRVQQRGTDGSHWAKSARKAVQGPGRAGFARDDRIFELIFGQRSFRSAPTTGREKIVGAPTAEVSV